MVFQEKEIESLKKDARNSFDSVKKDINSINGWINFLDSEKNNHKQHIDDIKEDLSSIKEEISNLKNIISFMGELKINGASKTPKQVFNKQTGVYPVQTAVQTAVQTPNLNHFSITERAILWVLLNTDMKLSYDDIAAMLGKERSTIRGSKICSLASLALSKISLICSTVSPGILTSSWIAVTPDLVPATLKSISPRSLPNAMYRLRVHIFPRLASFRLKFPASAQVSEPRIHQSQGRPAGRCHRT